MAKTDEQRLRLFLFGALALVLATALLAFAWRHVRGRLGVESWADYLGDNERASLSQAIAPTPAGPSADPNLNLHDIRLEPLQTVRHPKGELATFDLVPGHGATVEDAARRICRHWKNHGLEFRVLQSNIISARQPESGASYFLRFVRDTGAAGARHAIVWRLLPARVAARMQTDRATAPGWQRDLLPALPDSDGNMELGEPGRPGYSQMFDVYCQPRKAFLAVRDELRKRGWHEFEALGKLGNPSGVTIRGARSVVFRHPKAPLGCQLMVAAHPTQPGASQAFVALF